MLIQTVNNLHEYRWYVHSEIKRFINMSIQKINDHHTNDLHIQMEGTTNEHEPDNSPQHISFQMLHLGIHFQISEYNSTPTRLYTVYLNIYIYICDPGTRPQTEFLCKPIAKNHEREIYDAES